MKITISVTDSFLKRLDGVRGPTSRSAFIRWMIEERVDWMDYVKKSGPPVETFVKTGVVGELTSAQIANLHEKPVTVVKPVPGKTFVIEPALGWDLDRLKKEVALTFNGSKRSAVLDEEAKKLGYRIRWQDKTIEKIS